MDNNWKRKFTILWTGQFISLISSSAVNFAIIIWLSLKTGSTEVLAFSAIAALLPQALIGPFAGVYIDRWNRKRTMIFADGFVAVCTLCMSLSFYFGYESLLLIYVMLGLRSVGSAFHMPAMQASIPLLAPQSELLRIAGINQIIQSVSGIAGPALGAFAIGMLSIGNVLLLDILGALFAIISLLFIHIPNPKPEEKASGFSHIWNDMRTAFREISFNKGLSFLFLYSIIGLFCIMPVAVLFPLLTINHFKGDKFEISVIEIIWGVGMLIGGGLLGIWKTKINKVIIINLMHIVIGLTFAWSGWLSYNHFTFFVVLTAIGGISASLYNASFTTIIQEEIKSNMLGRVFSLYYSFSVLPSIIGLLFTGIIADFIGINRTFIILGLLIIVTGICSFLTPALMNLQKNKN
ncbi:MFS transporter, DHA3 family, macrolide efflux protein [Paenimyroides aquimaris]|uniref:MFS transporter, DHA3 family, macrolide efflux protein n=1 Tax=Paenimyroides marinum TaxID=1159016 RepID=A0A1H6K2U2_9FLAO|nr:MFS transporter [Paenimyroides aquimaris]SEH67245.1 MFS transporter, DHA3 family, macrolide efflux protein [Paenimyroides aquimaris]